MIQYTNGVTGVSGHKDTNFFTVASGLDKSTALELLSCVEHDDTIAEVIGVKPAPLSISASMNSVDGVVIGMPVFLEKNELVTGKKLGRGLLITPRTSEVFRVSHPLVGKLLMDSF